MKVCIHNKDMSLDEDKIDVIIKFIKFLNKEYPLNLDIDIHFLPKRIGRMSTGSRKPTHELKILTKNRMMRDILRTLGHEWVHEYEDVILNIPHKQHIGGKNENIANAEAGKVVKKFEKAFPSIENFLYE